MNKDNKDEKWINTEVHQYLYTLIFLELIKIGFKSMELCG